MKSICFVMLALFGLAFNTASHASATWVAICSTGVTPLCVDGAVSLPFIPTGAANNVAVTTGAVALGTNAVTVTATGARPGDYLICTLSSGATLVANLALAGCWVSANDTIKVVFLTPIALGISTSTFNMNFAWFR